MTLAVVVVAWVAAACVDGGATPPPAGVRPDGFPTGVFAKEFDDDTLGPMRLSWVFAADGNWAEVPEATAGQSMNTGPARGRYVVDGDLVTLEVDRPTFWGWTRHTWRFEGDRLITTYDSSELPFDEAFFATIDDLPWVRVP